MAWPERFDIAHTYHHVMSRGTNQWNVFLDELDRRRFLSLLAQACDRYGVEVVAFCLMGNHFHLILYCRDGELSSALRDLKSVYARRFNQRHRRSGPLYRERFRSKLVADDTYLLSAVRYVHRNPLELDATADLGTYVWSSHGIYLGLRPTPRWMQTSVVRRALGAQYRAFVEHPNATDSVQNSVASNTPIVDVPGTSTIGQPDLASILLAVAHAAGVDPALVRPRLHNGLIGVAIVIAVEETELSLREMAEPFGFRSHHAVQKQFERARRSVAEQPHVASTLERARMVLRRAA